MSNNNEDQDGSDGKKRPRHDCGEDSSRRTRRQRIARMEDLPQLRMSGKLRQRASIINEDSPTSQAMPTTGSSSASESTTSMAVVTSACPVESSKGSEGAVVVDETPLFEHKTSSRSRSERGCRCGRTRCLKQYCMCFRADQRCGEDCVCENCYNDGTHEKERAQAIRNIRVNYPAAFKGTQLELEGSLVRSPEGTVKTLRGCRCKRSKCQQKYCECYGAGLKCNANCLCENCLNGNEDKGEGVTPTVLVQLTRAAMEMHPSFHGHEVIPRVITGVVNLTTSSSLCPHTLRALVGPSSKSSLCTPPALPEGSLGSEEIERILAAQLASSITPRYFGIPSAVTPRGDHGDLRQARHGWGDDSPDPQGQGWEVERWMPAQLPAEVFSVLPHNAQAGSCKGYGAPSASYAPAAAACASKATSLVRGESLLASETPPCTPVAEVPCMVAALGLMYGSDTSGGTECSSSFVQPMSWGMALERNNSHDLIF